MSFLNRIVRLSGSGGIADQPGISWLPETGGAPPAVDPPHVEAKRIVDKTIGGVWALVHTTRILAGFCAAVAIFNGVGWFMTSMKSDMKVIEVRTNDKGEIGEIRLAEPLTLNTIIVDSAIRLFVMQCFTKYSDENATNTNRQGCFDKAYGDASIKPISARMDELDKQYGVLVSIRRTTPMEGNAGWTNVVWQEEEWSKSGKPVQCRESSGNFKVEPVDMSRVRMADWVKRPTFVYVTQSQFGYESARDGRCAW